MPFVALAALGVNLHTRLRMPGLQEFVVGLFLVQLAEFALMLTPVGVWLSRVYRPLPARTLRLQIANALILFSGLLVILFSALQAREMLNREESQATRHLSYLSDAVRGSVEEFLDKHTKSVVTLAHTIETYRLETPDAIRRLLESYRGQYQAMTSIEVGDIKGHLIARVPALPTAPDAPRAERSQTGVDVASPNFEAVRKSQMPVVSAAYASPETGKPVVDLSVPISGPNGEFIGLVTAVLDVSNILELGSRFPPRSSMRPPTRSPCSIISAR